jgi:hypothetical protein
MKLSYTVVLPVFGALAVAQTAPSFPVEVSTQLDVEWLSTLTNVTFPGIILKREGKPESVSHMASTADTQVQRHLGCTKHHSSQLRERYWSLCSLLGRRGRQSWKRARPASSLVPAKPLQCQRRLDVRAAIIYRPQSSRRSIYHADSSLRTRRRSLLFPAVQAAIKIHCSTSLSIF